MKPKLTLFTLLCLAAALACGLPVNPTPVRPRGNALQQTLTAWPLATPLAMPPDTPASGQTATPLVGPGASPTLDVLPTGGVLPTAPAPAVSPSAPTPWPTYPAIPGAFYTYTARSGDTLPALAGRFHVEPGQVASAQPIAPQGYLPPGQALVIPNTFTRTALTPPIPLLPDSELVYSPAAADFDLQAYVREAGGYLSAYQETLDSGETLSGAAIVQRVADELSVNPRLLLAVLDYRSGWVLGQPGASQNPAYPIGFGIADRAGLYQELHIAATQLNLAYYGWRAGTLSTLRYPNGSAVQIDPTLNAATVAIQHLLAMLLDPVTWQDALYGSGAFMARYRQMFGDPWALAVDPLLPPGLSQPVLALPFLPGEDWSLTAGPHYAWNYGTPRGALDFAPITGEAPCIVSAAWATAAAPGLVARSARNAVALDLDGDGREQTGWVLVYFHLADDRRTAAKTWAALDTPLGHPSCEGGQATGAHVHLARKYNGEWLAADGPVPFVLSGWQAIAAAGAYAGSLVKGEKTVISSISGMQGSWIVREAP
jgi:LysM repeat protein